MNASHKLSPAVTVAEIEIQKLNDNMKPYKKINLLQLCPYIALYEINKFSISNMQYARQMVAIISQQFCLEFVFIDFKYNFIWTSVTMPTYTTENMYRIQ